MPSDPDLETDRTRKQVRLRVGIPSGLARASMEALFKGAGLWVQNGNSNSFVVVHPDLECVFVRAQDIPRHVDSGALDCGLTGHDWIVEGSRQVVSVAELVCAKLNFGRTCWVLAVPQDSDCQSPEDLAGK